MGVDGYLGILGRRRLTVAVVMLLGLAAALAAALTRTPTYTANAQLYVSSSGTDSVSALLMTGSFAQQRVPSYTALVNSPLLLDQVRRQLRIAPGEPIVRSVSASNPFNTSLINITTADSSARRARDAAMAIGSAFGPIVESVEAPPHGKSPVKVTMIRPPTLPQHPTSPRVALYLALGLLGGLAVGVAAAVTRDSIDTSVRASEDLRERFELPPLASVPADSRAVSHPLITDHQSTTPRAESFRKLRTNLEFARVVGEMRTVLVTSAVAREGKTSTAANLAVSMSMAGNRVALIDADMRAGRVAELFGITPERGLADLLVGHATLDEVLVPWRDGLSIVTRGRTPINPSELLGSPPMTSVLDVLAGQHDCIVIDGPPALPFADATIIAGRVDATLLVVRRGTRGQQLQRALEALRSVDAHILGGVLNRARESDNGKVDTYFRATAEMIESLKAPGYVTARGAAATAADSDGAMPEQIPFRTASQPRRRVRQ